jgi:hypothetical protein
MAKKKERITEEYLDRRAEAIFHASTTWRTQKVIERWRKSNNLYDGVFESNQKKDSDALVGQGRLFIPKTYSHLQRMLVDLLEAFFFDPEEIVSIGNWKSIPYETREIVKVLLNYRLNSNPIQFYQEAYEACMDALKNKIGIFKVYPEIETNDDGTIKSYAPRIDCRPYEDVFFHIQATWKDYWKFPIIDRMIKSMDELKRQGYKNLNDVKPVSILDLNDQIKQQRAIDQGTEVGFFPGDKDTSLEYTVLYEIWDFIDVNGDGLLESCSYYYAGDAQGPHWLVKTATENDLPYKREGDIYNRPPILVGQAFPESHKMFGKDMPEIVEGLQKQTNASANQLREAMAISIRGVTLASRGAGLDLMTLMNRKIGSVVLGDDISEQSVRQFTNTPPPPGAYQEQAKIDQDFYETTSIPPNLLGMPSSQDETATAVTAHTANANKKIQMVINNMARTLFVPSFQMLLRLEQYYETDKFIEMVAGRKLGWGGWADQMPAKEYIQGEFELNASVGVNKQLQLNKLMLIMDRGNQYNATMAMMVQSGVVKPQDVKFFNPQTVLARALAILGEKEFKEFIIQAVAPPPEMGKTPGVASQTGLGVAPETDIRSLAP